MTYSEGSFHGRTAVRHPSSTIVSGPPSVNFPHSVLTLLAGLLMTALRVLMPTTSMVSSNTSIPTEAKE
ncbi:MAG TPA: hypothetical protein VMI35_04495 [Puia sp.]|nr:hypothetical protein [Puia sp.]